MRRRGLGWFGAFALAMAATSCAPAGAPDETVTVQSAVNSNVVVTVVNDSGTPQFDVEVMAQKNGSFVKSAWTNAQGKATLSLAAGSYRFATEEAGVFYYSGAAGHCTTPACTTASITMTHVDVNVVDTNGSPQSGLLVSWFDTAGNGGAYVETGANGHASVSVPPASYRFKVSINGLHTYSGEPGHCTVPSCTSATITVTVPVTVTVTDTAGAPIVNKVVEWENAAGAGGAWTSTNASGQAQVSVPPGSTRFEVVVDGTSFFSSSGFACVVPGCTSASILVSTQTVVTVVDGAGAPVSGKAVTPLADEAGVSANNKTTNASGQATFRLPFAHWRFRATCAANSEQFFSGNAGHCLVSGCTTAKITMPCGQCTGQTNGTTCNDQNPCTGTSTCQSQKCTGANPMNCTAGDACHEAGACSAETGACSGAPKANGTSCNDNDACTGTSSCQAGVCTGGNPVTCTASDQCHAAGTCNPATGTCSNPAVANGTSCNDGSLCTQADTCQSGTCTGGNPVTCTASDQCHAAGTCNPATGACSNPTAADGTACSDGSLCTLTDTCQSGTCAGGNPVTCTASDQCHAAGTCNPATGACSNPIVANGTSCNDGSLCTQADTCQSGTCAGGNPVTCTASDQCHAAGTCNPATGACSNPTVANGTSCNDGSLCTQTDTCQSGTCTGGNPVTCTASDQCHAAGTCNPATGSCSNPIVADGTSCNDGESCTGPDTCQSGGCVAGGNTCASIAVTQHVYENYPHPKLAATFDLNATGFVPGDVMSLESVVTNTGLHVDLSGDLDVANTGSSTFVVAGWQNTLEYQEVSSGDWIPFARATYDGSGDLVSETTLIQLHPGPYLTFGGSDVTYSSNPDNRLTGTSISAGGNGRWGWAMPVFLPADLVSLIFDPAQSSGLRAVFRVDVPSGAPQAGIQALSNPGETGSVHDVTVKAFVSGGGISNWVDLTPESTVPIAPGGTRAFSLSILAPVPGSTARDPEESETAYRDRLALARSYHYHVDPVVNGQGDTYNAYANQLNVTPPAMLLPIVVPVKSGPATITAGLTGTFSLTLPNTGDATAGPFEVTDTADGSPVTIANFTAPPTVAPATTGSATFTAQVPLPRPPGSMTDIAALTWKDGNGNVYGPLTASFTNSTTAGHPEGYLSLATPAPDVPTIVGSTREVVVTALDPYNSPAPGVSVHFAVTGVHAQTADIATGADGKATFTYTSVAIGPDTIVASANITTTQVTTNPVTVQWATAAGTPCTGRATPLDVMLVVDVSGSMVLEPPKFAFAGSAGKLEAARAAGDRFIDNLNYLRDQVGVVTFRAGIDSFAQLSTNTASAKTQLDAGIDNGLYCAGNFCPGTGSDLSNALNYALDELESARHRPEATKVIVYVGDGGADVDPSAAIARLRASGARAVAIGLGSNFDGLMGLVREIADSPNDYFYSPSGAGIDFAFSNLNQDLCRNRAPYVSAGGDHGAYSVRLPSPLTLQGEVHDDGSDGDQRLMSEWTLLNGPASVSIVNPSSPVTDVLFFEPGTYTFQLSASDGYLTVADRATITVDPDPSIVGASLAVALSAPGPLETGQTETLTATLLDGLGAPIRNFVVTATVAGANPIMTTLVTDNAGVATFTYRGAKSGTDVIHATAIGSTLHLDSANVSVQWVQPATGGPVLTQGWIGAPKHQDVVMGRVSIALSPDVTLASGTVTYAPTSAPTDVHTLASNVSGAPDAEIATFDTTLVANDSYVIQLAGTDQSGNQKTSIVLVTVTGDYKPGRVVVEMTDLTVPLAGLPITIGRRYDSLEKDKVGDFGHGWSLAIGHPRVQMNPDYGVTLTLPNGRRATFGLTIAMKPEQIIAGPFNPFPGVFFPAYQAEPGVFGTLTQEGGCPAVRYNPSNPDNPIPCFFTFGFVPDNRYAPEYFTYTDPYGTAYRMAASGELKSITDRQGNRLSFEANGIISSTGRSVTWERDAEGRITKVDYPALFGPYQDAANYTYDAAGDLVTVTLAPANNAGQEIFEHTYAQHRLLTTKDPRGNTARSSNYYPDGRLQSDKDARDSETTYEYDLETKTTTTRYPDEGEVVQKFDTRGLLLSETDQLGHTTTHEYDANRQETKRTNDLGEETTFVYDPITRNQTDMTDPLGTTHTEYNDQNLPTKFVDRLHKATHIDYDDRGLPVRIWDERGTRFRFTNSEQGLPLTIDDAEGHRAYLMYDVAGNVTSRTDWLGRETRATYDEGGRRVTETSARGGVSTNKYFFGFGRLATAIDAEGHNVGYRYDVNGNLYAEDDSPFLHGGNAYTYDALNHLTQALHNPEGTTVNYTRDFRGNPLTMTDENSHTTTYEYDLAGQLKKTTFADGTFTTRTYDELNRLATVTDERHHPTTYQYGYQYDPVCDCVDRVETVIDPLGNATKTKYDGNERRKAITDANNHTTRFVYDERGHVVETHYPDTTTTYEVYDSRGRRTSMTDQTGATTLYGYDDQGQLTSVTDPLEDVDPGHHVTHYAYDLDGNLASVTDANGHTTSYEYDRMNRKTKRTLPMGQFETFKHDLAGRLTEQTEFSPAGTNCDLIPSPCKTTTMTYDTRDRMLTKAPDSSRGEATHVYTYWPNGLRKTATNAAGTTTYTYDVRDRMLTKAATAGNLTYTYDDAGNVATIRSSNTNGTSVDYLWNDANQLVSVTDNRVGGTTTAAYTPTNRPSTLAQPNGIGLTYSYDALDRVTSMLWRQGSAAPFGTWSYTHNERGQRLTSTDITGRAAAYTYDSAARLATESISGDPRGAGFNGGLSYVLDAVGNQSSRTSTLAALGAQSFTYNANDETSGDTFDANGNTTASGGHTYAYDFENRLVSHDTGAVTIAYDCDGNRVVKTVGGVTTRYLVDDLNPTGYLQVFEEVVGGAVQTRYTYGDRIVSQTRDVSTMPATSYYGFDAHENITFLTDATGTVTASYDYDAWGNLVASTGSTPNSRLYAGEELDADLGLINLRARQYRPDVGRFLTIDPVMGTLQNPISLNTHLYANGESVNLVDPNGTMAMVERGLLVPFQERLVQIAAVGLAAALCGYYHAISALDPGIEVPFCRASDLTKKRRRYWDDWFRNQEQLPVPNGRCWPEFIACMAFCDPDSADAYVGWHRLTCLEQFKACVRNGGG